MTPIQKLDIVLNYLADQFPLYKIYTDGDIFSPLVAKHPELNEQGDFGSELLSVLEKLSKDEFVKTHTYPKNQYGFPLYDRYQITFEGVYFIKHQDGYQVLQNQKISENTRLDKIESEQRVNRNWTLWLTIILAFSAVATVVYYCVELYWNHGWFQIP